MSDDLQDLRDDYQGVTAPHYLAARVRARVNERQHSVSWLPRVATLALIVALPLAIFTDREPSVEYQYSKIPSLSQLMPEKPSANLSSLGSLRSVRLPSMPSRPGSPARVKPLEDTETLSPDRAPIPEATQKPVQSRYLKHTTTEEAHYEHV